MFAAETAECASRQGKFWELHDALFAPDFKLSRRSLEGVAVQMGLNVDSLSKCLSSDAESVVKKDLADASRFGIDGTPGFLVGQVQPDGSVNVTDRINGTAPFERFQQVLDGALKTSR
jgi:protein-disulfide isomerase